MSSAPQSSTTLVYSELEKDYRFLHDYMNRKRSRWDQHPDDPPPEGPLRVEPYFSGKRMKRRTPDDPLGFYQEPYYGPPTTELLQSCERVDSLFERDRMTPLEKLGAFLARPTKVKQLLEKGCLDLDAFTPANPDVHLKFELVEAPKFLRKDDFKACYNLVKETSRNDYKNSSIGWKPKEKKEEMRDEDMIYLLVRKPSEGGEEPTEILGFASFMFCKDDPPYEHVDVVYIFEVHLTESLRGRGLGRQLIQFIEFAAGTMEINKAMLTVFKVNDGARRLYTNLGYTKDRCSPEDRVTRKGTIEADYIIMSKEMPDRF